ncbi:MAG: IS30 family transposase, partial [Actinomycetota bacterium]|nr:IS30 family transposase [Actinomycetota bacterium]
MIRLAAQGKTYRQIIDEAGVSAGSVRLITGPYGGVIRPEMWSPCAGRLSLEDRIEVKMALEAGLSFAAIGRRLGRATSTISREVGGTQGRAGYRPMEAHRVAAQRARRPKATKLASNPVLCARVAADLEQLWSPEEIVGRLRREFPDNPEMHVSHETIYKSLFIQSRGELRRELVRHLRTGRTRRQARGRSEHRGRIPDMVPISQRPPEVADRAVPGHWEGDLLVGVNSRSAVGTVVERTSRLTVLLHLPDNHTAAAVRTAAAEAILELPEALRRTLTWDQGKEMADHAAFTIDTGVQVYFCDPHSPWQRPTNENTNKLLRQYLPKGTDLAVHSRADLKAIADSL